MEWFIRMSDRFRHPKFLVLWMGWMCHPFWLNLLHWMIRYVNSALFCRKIYNRTWKMFSEIGVVTKRNEHESTDLIDHRNMKTGACLTIQHEYGNGNAALLLSWNKNSDLFQWVLICNSINIPCGVKCVLVMRVVFICQQHVLDICPMHISTETPVSNQNIGKQQSFSFPSIVLDFYW